MLNMCSITWGIVQYGMRYVGDGKLMLHKFVDFDWPGNAGDMKSTSSCCLNLG